MDTEREILQPDFTNINKENERPLPREVSPTENFPPTNYNDIETELECPPPEEVPPLAANIFFKDEDAPPIIQMNKRKKDANVPSPLKEHRTKRMMKPSKYIVTPYTEGKKKKEKQIMGDKAIIEVVEKEKEQVEEKGAELPPTRLQCDPHSI
ncbi:uncharacterized protein A4U43_C05F12190 [Asparagus officinalis]|uniref:Uncharacterized protein n=1 Tax=Asparagus officinalis TaxID=4686 RepID=A0A5P1ER42_ASPOF|nr:uncharacterized protein A4U43_C05F12190 [Asparagus officinalis]